MDDLTRLKLMTDEYDPPMGAAGGACDACVAPASATRMFTDEQLMEILELHDDDVRAAAYDVLIRKAESSGIRLSGGTELPDQRAYWMSRARSVRPNGTRPIGRADRT